MFNLRKKISKQCLLYLDAKGCSIFYYDRDHLGYETAWFDQRSFDVGIGRDLKSFVEQHHLMKMPLSVVLGASYYQMILIDKPKVNEKELNQAVGWLVKDQMQHAPDDVFIQTIEIPEFQLGQAKIYVVAVQRDIMYALQQAAEYADLKLIETGVFDLSLAKLLEPQGHVCVFYEQANQLYFLCVSQGLLRFKQVIGEIKDDSKETLRPFSLQCQRALDQYQVAAQASLEKCYLSFDLFRSNFAKQVNLTLSFQALPILPTVAEFSFTAEEFEKIWPLVGELQYATEG